ncbi:MAG: DUF3089 domain-containing protein [Bacteroidetes bacterium]|nr:DUF3089 domain-containing protein [Bacteroidota bacterium]
MRLFYFFLLSALAINLFSCSNKHIANQSRYQFHSKDGKPDYADLNYWAAHPSIWDPSDSVPRPLQNEWRDTSVDVFFLHPTIYIGNKLFDGPNAAIDNAKLNRKTDYSTILYQASVFNQQCRVFAPRYRQAHISTFFLTNKEKADEIFALAYEDLKNAFEYYLKHWNNGRPIIIASHSQGSLHAERLLKEYFENKPLANKLVAAYIIGWPVPKEYISSIPICADSLQTGCICTWRTFRKNYVPIWLRKENGNSFVTNPLSWKTDGVFISRNSNKGSILKNFNKIVPYTTDAQISNGLLYTRKPKFPGSFLYLTKNYHVGDINLYYVNMRENISRRIAMYWKK